MGHFKSTCNPYELKTINFSIYNLMIWFRKTNNTASWIAVLKQNDRYGTTANWTHDKSCAIQTVWFIELIYEWIYGNGAMEYIGYWTLTILWRYKVYFIDIFRVANIRSNEVVDAVLNRSSDLFLCDRGQWQLQFCREIGAMINVYAAFIYVFIYKYMLYQRPKIFIENTDKKVRSKCIHINTCVLANATKQYQQQQRPQRKYITNICATSYHCCCCCCCLYFVLLSLHLCSVSHSLAVIRELQSFLSPRKH